jgi:putative peptidoglycan lipid II flippase
MEFPLGILGVALATVILPRLSRRQAEAEPEAFSHTLDWGLRMTVIFGIPAAVGLTVLAGPMIASLFQSDVFDANDVAMAERSLMAYAFGLQAFILIKVLAPGFYARQDTRTPVRIGVIAMAVNMLLNLAFIFPLQHAGLALATSLSAYLNAFLLLRNLRREKAYLPGPGWRRLALQVGVAAVLMATLLVWVSPQLGGWIEAGRLQRVGMLAGLIGLGAGVYFAVLLVLGVRLNDLRVRNPPEAG